MNSRQRDEQETRNTAEVMTWIEHHRFTSIHPFRDGNGRTARAITTLLLWGAGFPAEILLLQRVLDVRRADYIESLRRADQGDVQSWVVFFAEALRAALQLAVSDST